MSLPADSQPSGQILQSEVRDMLSHVDEKVNFHVQYYRARALESEKAALVFAQNSIKTSQILNGGGLIAIPAFVTLFNLSVQAGQSLLVASAATFTVGLCLAWASNLMGYLSETNKGTSMISLAEAQEYQIRHIYDNAVNPDAPKKSELFQEELKISKRKALKFRVFRYFGTFFVVFSMNCFIVGAFLGYRAITEIPQRAQSTVPSAPAPIVPMLLQPEK